MREAVQCGPLPTTHEEFGLKRGCRTHTGRLKFVQAKEIKIGFRREGKSEINSQPPWKGGLLPLLLLLIFACHLPNFSMDKDKHMPGGEINSPLSYISLISRIQS